MMAFRNRAAEKARQAARGGDGPPAGRDPQVPGEPVQASIADRGALRKRLRDTRRRRDVVLHELGALVMEMHRQGRHDRALVERKARDAIEVDTEARTLAGALDRNEPIGSLQAAGIAGPCASCGNLLVRGDRFCGRCGAAAGSLARQPVREPAPPAAGDRVGPGTTAPPRAADRVEPGTAAPPRADDRVASPPSAADRVAAPPSADERVDAPPPSAGDRVDRDGVPTYTVTTR